MDEETDRFQLPLLQPGQAQKELFHNEALATIDRLLHASARAMAIDTPPEDAAEGECWIVGADPSGDWTGHAHALAAMTVAGWRLSPPRRGMTVWVEDIAIWARWDGAAWIAGDWPATRLIVAGIPVVGAQQPAIAAPLGGTTVDAEARAALSAVLAALRSHGLVAS